MFQQCYPGVCSIEVSVAVWPLAMTNDDTRGRYRPPLRLGHGDIATATTATYIWHCLYLLSKGRDKGERLPVPDCIVQRVQARNRAGSSYMFE